MKYFTPIFRELNKAKVKYIVVGGVAVVLHGYVRTTMDLDILLLLEEKNLKKMDEVMKKLNYGERLPVSIMFLKDHKLVKKWLKEKNMTAFAFFPPVENPITIDILAEESLRFNRAKKNSVKKKVDDITIPIVSIKDLIRMKKKAGRPKDLIDLEYLLLLKDL